MTAVRLTPLTEPALESQLKVGLKTIPLPPYLLEPVVN
jgi:hypothetical protein